MRRLRRESAGNRVTVHLFWCCRPDCHLMTSNVLKADHHEREHPEIRKIGTLP